jgi:hypothetical protein
MWHHLWIFSVNVFMHIFHTFSFSLAQPFSLVPVGEKVLCAFQPNLREKESERASFCVEKGNSKKKICEQQKEGEENVVGISLLYLSGLITNFSVKFMKSQSRDREF